MNVRRLTRSVLCLLVATLILAPIVLAAKPGPGVSTGSGRVFFPNLVASLQDQTLTDQKDVLRFGKGGVDDAEDAEVILHEYGHAMLDSQSTPFGAFGASLEADAIHEGFGDYWAATVTDVIAPTPDPACIADWDAVSYTAGVPHCLRRGGLFFFARCRQ